MAAAGGFAKHLMFRQFGIAAGVARRRLAVQEAGLGPVELRSLRRKRDLCVRDLAAALLHRTPLGA